MRDRVPSHDRVRSGDRIHPWQFALALCAVLVPLPPAIGFARFMDGPGQPLAVGVTAAFVALPLLFHHRRDDFARAARIMAGALLPWACAGALFGTAVFFLAAPLLLLASFADPRRRRVTAAAVFASGLLLTAAVTALPGYWQGS
ncbi:hypothetical protein [Streptomyces sp. NPDC059564]|uniref:hypothetical protein n=1 Tax=Streptomyces sp. NPDC059564 TaxID=3346865 RepID=UPI0036A25586